MSEGTRTLKHLFRPEALAFPRYSLNEKSGVIRLHQNETLGLEQVEREEFARVLAQAAQQPESINTYPSLQPDGLLQAFSEMLQIPAENIEVTAGSSQALTLLAEALFAPGRSVAITAPSFSLYAHLARLYGSTVVDLKLSGDFSFAEEQLFSADVLRCSSVILCSPNNPTGTLCPVEHILKFANRFTGVLIVDEAYIEFVDDAARQSFVSEAIRRDNVIVLRTLSKAWAAAGLRVGALIANREIIDLFRALKPPYSIAWPSEVLATYVLRHKRDLTRARVEKIKQQRDELQTLLRSSGAIDVLSESQANFVFFTSQKAQQVEQALTGQNFLVRRYTSGPLADAVRISMPPASQFQSLKNILQEVLL